MNSPFTEEQKEKLKKQRNEKFVLKNKDEIEALDLFLKENDVQIILTSFEIFTWLKELGLVEESILTRDKPLGDSKYGKYKGVRVLGNAYRPVSIMYFIIKDVNKISFNMPCNCGVYPDEDHNWMDKLK